MGWQLLPTKRGKMKVIVADKISERGVELLKETVRWKIVQTTKETLGGELGGRGRVDRAQRHESYAPNCWHKAPKLRAVGRAGVGVDNIDLDAATKRGVLVMSTPGGSSVSVAEHTLALLLALVRRIAKIRRLHARRPMGKIFFGRRKFAARRLALIGLGRIGGKWRCAPNAFDMRVLAFDPLSAKRRRASSPWIWSAREAACGERFHFAAYGGGAANAEHDQRGERSPR